MSVVIQHRTEENRELMLNFCCEHCNSPMLSQSSSFLGIIVELLKFQAWITFMS